MKETNMPCKYLDESTVNAAVFSFYATEQSTLFSSESSGLRGNDKAEHQHATCHAGKH